jgi:hypothetical protein
MQSEQTQNELIISETPGCVWIMGLFFALVGGILVYGALGGFTDWGLHPFWTLALTFLMGSSAVGVGVWIFYGAPITRVVIDRIENSVEMTRYGLFGKRESIYDFAEIKEFCLIEDEDDESNRIWYLGMKLTDDELVKISSHPSHDEQFKQNFVFQINEFMDKQLPATEMILELEDEN